MRARWRGWMSHDATGKFSSRWPLPDRSSLAVVIGNRLVFQVNSALVLAFHIREQGAKTNAMQADPRPDSVGLSCYWPWFLSTWSQASLILARFSFRQARMVKSP